MQQVGDQPNLAAYLQGHLDQRGWTPSDLVRASEKADGKALVLSSVTRWIRNETVPSIDACRSLAAVLGVPVLEVLVAAGILTEAEAQLDAAPKFQIRHLSGREIVVEIERRLELTDQVPDEGAVRKLNPVRRAAYPKDMDS